MTWLPVEPSDRPTLGARVGLGVEVDDRLEELRRDLWRAGGVDPRLLELCRLRVDQLVGDRGDLAARSPAAVEAGLDEGKVAELPAWSESPRFDATDRAVLAFTELYVMDAHAVTDDDCAEVTAVLPPAGVATLTTSLAVFEGLARLRVALGVDRRAPEQAAAAEGERPGTT